MIDLDFNWADFGGWQAARFYRVLAKFVYRGRPFL
jgi:hypothetical protein